MQDVLREPREKRAIRAHVTEFATCDTHSPLSKNSPFLQEALELAHKALLLQVAAKGGPILSTEVHVKVPVPTRDRASGNRRVQRGRCASSTLHRSKRRRRFGRPRGSTTPKGMLLGECRCLESGYHEPNVLAVSSGRS